MNDTAAHACGSDMEHCWMSHDGTTAPTGDYFRPGDARALFVYAPDFMVKTVRQTNPFPGMLNSIQEIGRAHV